MRVEAVNLSHFVYDTHDISTIRGGSYILLEAIERIAKQFSGRLYVISTAASQGLFFFDCEDNTTEGDKEKLRAEVLKFLRTETRGHATFLVAVEKDEQNFPLTLEKLEAQIHRQQWRTPTVIVPNFEKTEQECFLDGWRPGTREYRADMSDVRISTTTRFRRDVGIILKRQLFSMLLKSKKYTDNLCSKNLGELALDTDQGVLNGKIAFIHIDGNSFGAIRRDLCVTPELREQFDNTIQKKFREPFLESLLQQADKDPEFKTKDEEGHTALRLEVLLWGGDEMTLIVPAWKGWEVLQLFFNQARNLTFADIPLSHRAVIIFSHHNAPILQIRRLAEELLSQTKQDLQKNLIDALRTHPKFSQWDEAAQKELVTQLSDHEYGNAIHYLVLESFDMLQGSLSNFLSLYYQGVSYQSLLIPAYKLAELQQNVQNVRPHIARSKVIEVIKAIQKGQPDPVAQVKQQIYDLIPSDKRNEVQAALESLTQEWAGWYKLADLWDYIPESLPLHFSN
ncbi:MAG: hypothetical protein BroJett011_18850 [Chloroflexota bacterium]|nr:MAG: hypothetical protein BroJett011_18850 [Chloroflexota bacterium]